jgi:hypothetical protein
MIWNQKAFLARFIYIKYYYQGGICMRAIKIKIKSGSFYSSDVQEIDSIYIMNNGVGSYSKKADVHDYLKKYPGTIQVDIYPYPNLIPEVSTSGEKYVRSTPDASKKDNLMNLPKEY